MPAVRPQAEVWASGGSAGSQAAAPFGADLRGGARAGGAAAAIAALPCADRGQRLVEATKQSALALKWAPWDLKGDRGVVTAVVRGNWRSLEHAPDELRADKQVVRAAVEEGGEDALRFASCELRRDPELKQLAGRANSQLRRAGPGVSAPAFPAAAGGAVAAVGSGAAAAGASGAPRSFTARRVAAAVHLLGEDGPGVSKDVPISYAWLEGGALEIEVPRDLGAPTAELRRPGEAFGPGVERMGIYLRLVFPGSKLADWGPRKQIRVPVPYGSSLSSSLKVLATSSPPEVKEAVEERRVDPDDQLFCTLMQLRQKYIGRFNEAEIQQYWKIDCEPLDESLWLRHEEYPMVTWAVRPVAGGFRCAPPPANALTMQAEALATDLQDRGWSVLDGFLQAAEADAVHVLMRRYWEDSRFKAGMIGIGIQKQEVRGDIYAIGEIGSLPDALKVVQHRVQQLVSQLGRVVDRLRASLPVEVEPPMMAVYPGGGARYMRHFDGLEGPQQSGLMQPRVCTLIAYFNPFWCEEHGGQLRLYPDAVAGPPGGAPPPPPKDERSVDVEPLHGRLLAFLCQGRNAHEVMPAWRPRFAVTWWVRESRRDDAAAWDVFTP